jgi:hypothetical protein
MFFPCQTVIDLVEGAAALRAGRAGEIEIIGGQLHAIRLRRFARRVSLLESWLQGRWHHARRPGDCCRLYYHQPRQFPNFLALDYVVSTRGASFATFRRALTVLDEIARLKESDALLCDASNARISDRLLARWGWQSHAPMRWRRNFIKRFPAAERRLPSTEWGGPLATCR